MNRYRVGAKLFIYLADNSEKISACPVHLVYKSDPGNIVFISLSPYSLRLRFNAAYRTKDSDRAVKDSERTLHLDSEIHVTRGIYNIYLIVFIPVFPERRSSSRGDCNSSFLLLNHPVHLCITIMHLAHPVSTAGIEQNTLCRCRFTGINMGHYSDVSGIFQAGVHLAWVFPCNIN